MWAKLHEFYVFKDSVSKFLLFDNEKLDLRHRVSCVPTIFEEHLVSQKQEVGDDLSIWVLLL